MPEQSPRISLDTVVTPLGLGVVTFGLPVLVLAFFLLTASHFDYTPDDTYIYLQYAENLASGEGLSFNPGRPSYGMTGPLWLLLIAAGAVGDLDPYSTAKVLDLILASLALILLYLLAVTMLRSRVLAFAAAAFLATDVWYVRWSSSGLDSSLAVLLAILAVTYAYRNSYQVAAFVAGALTLVRPEGSLLMLVLLIDNMLNSTDWRRSLRAGLWMTAWYSVTVVPWLLVAAGTFGTILPNTFTAKSGTMLSPAGIAETAGNVALLVGSSQAVVCLLLGSAVFVLLQRKKGKSLRSLKSEIFPLLWAVLLPVFYVAAEVQVVSRYLLPAVPFLILGALWGLRVVVDGGLLKPRLAIVLLAGLLTVHVAQNQFLWWKTVRPHVEGFAEGVRYALKPIGYWLKDNGDANAIVFSPDPGVIGYVSGKTVLDFQGIVAPEARAAFAGTTYDESMTAGRFRSLPVRYVVDRAPDGGRLRDQGLSVVMEREFPSLSLAGAQAVVYTLYEVPR